MFDNTQDEDVLLRAGADFSEAMFWKLAEQSLQFEYIEGMEDSMKEGATTEWRSLPFFVVCHVSSGRMLIHLKSAQKKWVEAGETFCMSPGIEHKADALVAGVVKWSHVNFVVLRSLPITTFFEIPLVYRGKTARKLADLNNELAFLDQSSSSAFSNLVERKVLGFQLFQTLMQESKISKRQAFFQPHAERLAPVLNFIQQNLGSSLRREELAKLAHLSPSRFHVVFTRSLGIAPRFYIQQLRLRHAQELLISSNLSVKEIAYRCGHEDEFHFSRIFKKKCRVSPSVYARQIRTN